MRNLLPLKYTLSPDWEEEPSSRTPVDPVDWEEPEPSTTGPAQEEPEPSTTVPEQVEPEP